MANRITHYQRELLNRVARIGEADGWRLLDLVESTSERNCVGTPVEVFFPATDENSPVEQKVRERARIAKKCAGCPVIDECLTGALLRGERYGGWGGVAQPDYRALLPHFRVQQRRAARKVVA